MNTIEFRAFLDLMMCSDPWPARDKDGMETGQDTLNWLANRIALDYGFSDWIEAYHKHVA